MALATVAGCVRTARPAPSNTARTVEGVLVPSQLDPAISAVTTASGADARHYYCAPSTPAAWNGQLVIYLVAAREDPAAAHAFAEHACGRGFATIAPAYRNERAIRDVCMWDAACYEAVRREIVYGEDLPTDVVRIDAANGIVHRLDTIADELARQHSAVWRVVRDALAHRDFTHVVLAGFSQGAGHALILAHDHAAARVILLSGVVDRLGTGTIAHAPVGWISSWASTSPRTPGSAMTMVRHAEDPFTTAEELDANADALGIPAQRCPYDAHPYPARCHRIVIPEAGCQHGVDAHVTPSVVRFGAPGAPCQLGGPLHHNGPTWDFLLGWGR